MSANIFITGACGYIGGSIVASFTRVESGLLQDATIHAAVRSEEQAESLADLNVTVVRIDLSNPYALAGYMTRNDVSVVIHTATSIDGDIAHNLIEALKRRRDANGKKAYFIHKQNSGLSAFDESTGWPFGHVKDIDPVYFLEKQCTDTYVMREVDVLVAEQAEAAGLTGLIVMPSALYGRGTGTWNKRPSLFPTLIKAAIDNRQVYKSTRDIEVLLTHISDLTGFYTLLVEAVLQKRALPAGTSGYYFTVSHPARWWEILDQLAIALHARGLVDEPTTKIWPSDTVSGAALEFPANGSQPMWDSSPKVTCVNKDLVGWKPAWDSEALLQSIDEEIETWLELGNPTKSPVENS
ncbi:hypothetical protein POX_c04505 [Penicillium oxalicum]|uniref:NmrA-like domain-containing protein n=1 Tax=Penicillium oxalicum (strain 114-2 / CGMCC 5302) TaxID=933388 RepID=S8AW63_PENO1|nr:hypothetical protein POX_c04505 [Penicillium oxalicum]EPS26122.1 hypothetical protein PDE_01058 [Penicillium oxalicum 114-2]KAI2791639.1 hypothetical protein POX_c04505 [Penicillium oxalicum]